MKLSLLMGEMTDFLPSPDTEILRVTERADAADGASVFVCIKGALADGHHFATVAYQNGCRVFVAEREIALPSDAFVLRVNSTREALAALACRFYGHPSRKMRLIGVTGTKGKTTTARLLAHILNESEIPCGYIGTNGVFYADQRLDCNNTTPDAITLQSTLAKMCESGVKTAVIEVSSQALMQFRADGTRFEGVIFTNLTPDHIGPREHESFEHYKACKMRLFTDFGANLAIFNADDAHARDFSRVSSAEHRIFCSQLDSGADFYADSVSLMQSETTLGISFDLCTENTNVSISLPLTGRVNASNALLALATANRVFDIPLSDAIKALSCATVEGRAELISLSFGASAVVDYAHTGKSLAQLLHTLREYKPSRLIVLFGSIGERAQMRRVELGTVAAELADLAILTSDNPNFEDPSAIIEEIATAFSSVSTPYLVIPDRAKAIQEAVSLLQKGDLLVLAGKGHETYQLINGEKRPFCERDILLDAAQKRVLLTRR